MTFLIFLSALCLVTCKKPEPSTRVSAIRNGKIFFSDSTAADLPHHLDWEYTTFYIVRYAEKADDGTDDPGLSPAGMQRAERLGNVLQYARLDEIAAPNFKRTLKTAEPLQKKAGLHVLSFPNAGQEAWLTSSAAQKGKRFLYIGHQNTVPFILNKLTGKTTYQNIPDDTYDRLYIAFCKGLGETEVLEFSY